MGVPFLAVHFYPAAHDRPDPGKLDAIEIVVAILASAGTLLVVDLLCGALS